MMDSAVQVQYTQEQLQQLQQLRTFLKERDRGSWQSAELIRKLAGKPGQTGIRTLSYNLKRPEKELSKLRDAFERFSTPDSRHWDVPFWAYEIVSEPKYLGYHEEALTKLVEYGEPYEGMEYGERYSPSRLRRILSELLGTPETPQFDLIVRRIKSLDKKIRELEPDSDHADELQGHLRPLQDFLRRSSAGNV